MECLWYVPMMGLKHTVTKPKRTASRSTLYTTGLKPQSKIRKKSKTLKVVCFLQRLEQVYEKDLALSLEEKLLDLGLGEDLLEVKVIDSNPANNPQPPSLKQQDS